MPSYLGKSRWMIKLIPLIAGLLFVTIQPLTTALFFTGIISFLFIYMLILIKDLDNPFSFYEQESAEEVTLKLLDDLENRLREEIR